MKKLISLVLLLLFMCSCSNMVVDTEPPTVQTVIRFGTPYYYDNSLVYYHYNGYYYYPYRGYYYHRYSHPIKPRKGVPRYTRPKGERPYKPSHPRRH